jgi:TatD DNase family protein
MKLYDAHNHLHDPRLDSCRDDALGEMQRIGVVAAVVNGTHESDWDGVARLTAATPWLRPSFGLHPWFVAERTAGWFDELRRRLDRHPNAVIGEIGLDRWIEGHDLDLQRDIFTKQLAIAAERNLPAAIHCLKAWGALSEIIRTQPLPSRGILLHSYGGPEEMIGDFVKYGGYFSFSPYFLHARKERQRQVFASIPVERLLVETDAPDMAPPPERNARPISEPKNNSPINHPANLDVSYAGLAEVRQTTVSALAPQVEENYRRLFGASPFGPAGL